MSNAKLSEFNSKKTKQDKDNYPRPLTQAEKDWLRQDMKESSEWMKAELKRLGEKSII